MGAKKNAAELQRRTAIHHDICARNTMCSSYLADKDCSLAKDKDSYECPCAHQLDGALVWAAGTALVEVLDVLLAAGFADVVRSDGRNALMVAAAGGNAT